MFTSAGVGGGGWSEDGGGGGGVGREGRGAGRLLGGREHSLVLL